MISKSLPVRLAFLGIALTLLGWISSSPARLQAQACSPMAGNNLVYGTCSGSLTAQYGSTAYIDLSAISSGLDICGRINAVLSSTTTPFKSGTVIDARGVAPGTCATDPFYLITKNSIVLLPAGTITLSTAWAIPDQTQVIGEGQGITILKAKSPFADAYVSSGSNGTVNPALLHMGVPSYGSNMGKIGFSVRIVHLTLDGFGQELNSTYIDGIDNNNAEEQSYVDDVVIQNVLGNGLYLSSDPTSTANGAADHSGPYTNIVFQQTSGGSAMAGTTCVNVTANVEPRGIHGITCLGDASSTPNNAIVLNGNSTTIEDARIDGFKTGVSIAGSSTATDSPSQANLVFNITGTATLGSGVSNLIDIVSSTSGTANGSWPINIAIMGASLTPGAPSPCTINDQTTSSCLSDTHVGMYLLGQPFNTSSVTGALTYGYSRFSTSKTFATWVVGDTTGSLTGKACSSSGTIGNGSIFSSTSGTGGNLWACVAGTWQ
jgi:hypothetical protein